MTFRQAALIVAVSLTTGVSPLAVGAQTEDAVLKELDRAIQDASVSGDAALLERHLADDFAFTHFGGNRDDKAHWVGLARRNPRPVPAPGGQRAAGRGAWRRRAGARTTRRPDPAARRPGRRPTVVLRAALPARLRPARGPLDVPLAPHNSDDRGRADLSLGRRAKGCRVPAHPSPPNPPRLRQATSGRRS